MEILYLIIILIVTYLIGSIPFGFLVAKSQRIDIRQKGSGNIGMTNVWRVLGWKFGLPVFILDFLKGFLPVFFVGQLISETIQPLPMGLFLILVGFAAIAGHIWTIYLHFKGGKGVATGTGVFFALAPIAVAAAIIIFFLLVLPTRYISLGSISATISLPLIMALQIFVFDIYPPSIFTLYLAIFISIFVAYTHRENIQRLINGTENRFGVSKSS